MSEVDRELLRRPFETLRVRLANVGVDPVVPWVAVADQVRQAIRRDLATVGVDPAEPEQVAAAIAGLAVGLKACMTLGVSNPPFYAHWLALADQAFAVLDEPVPDLADLAGDLGDLFDDVPVAEAPAPDPPAVARPPMCSACGQNVALLSFPDGSRLCVPCAAAGISPAAPSAEVAAAGTPAGDFAARLLRAARAFIDTLADGV